MREFNVEEVRVETVSALEAFRRSQWVGGYPAYIKESVHAGGAFQFSGILTTYEYRVQTVSIVVARLLQNHT